MKNWLTIGQFAKKVGVSTRTLRVYEAGGLISSHTRGENGYRYYLEDQLERMNQILKFKKLGFELAEIKTLFDNDGSLSIESLQKSLDTRLGDVLRLERDLSEQKEQIQKILTSLVQNQPALGPQERKYIMKTRGNAFIVVTGIRNLEMTAQMIQKQMEHLQPVPEILRWDEELALSSTQPSILILPEGRLQDEKVREVRPDIVVIQNISVWNPKIESHYLNLFEGVGPHMSTVFNADDQISVELAANEKIRRGRTFYFSKNSGLEEQIRKIGGVVSDGEQVRLYGFNLKPEVIKIPLEYSRPFDEEICLLAALTGVLDLGLEQSQLRIAF